MDKTTKILIGVVATLAVLAVIVFGLVFFGLFRSGPEEPGEGTIATVEPLLTPTATAPVAGESFITILEPRTGAIVDISQPVTVAGRGGGLPEGNVVVQALDPDGNVLAEEAATIDAPDAGTGGEGPWAVALDIDVEPGIAGRIRAFSPSPEDNSIVAEAVVEVSLGQTAAVPVFIQIDEPLPGTILDIDQPVTVRGIGGGLPEGNVVVEAIGPNGAILAQQATIVDAPDAGTGGQGPWATELDIRVQPGTPGQIRAFSPSPADNSILAEARVDVVYDEPPGDIPPVAVIEGPSRGTVGEPVVFSGANSRTTNRITSFEWDLGDGTRLNAVQVEHIYDQPAIYNVRLTVVDENNLSNSTNFQIDIRAAPPEPTEEPTEEPTAEPTEEPTAEPTEEPEGGEIEGVDWVLASALPGTEITALFEGGMVTGSSGCNTYNAGYTINGNQISISPPSGSQLACDDDIMAQEATYLAALTNVSSYQVSGDTLTLSGTANLVYNAR